MVGKQLKRSHEASNGASPEASLALRKRQRQSKSGDIALAKLYQDLAAESEDVRMKAAKDFLQKFSPENGEDAQSMRKALSRLIKGLCSQRKAARFGFFITLTEFLRQLVGQNHARFGELHLGVNGIVELVETTTQHEGNVSGQERRDHLIGRLFGYKAIIQSSVLLQPNALPDSWNAVIDRICAMAHDIPWLREECGLILYEAVMTIDPKLPTEFIQNMVERLISSKLINTPEAVAIWIAIRTNYSDTILPKDIWHHKDPLSKKERSRLARLLREDFRNQTEDGNVDTLKTAAANPNPIFAWDVVLREILKTDGEPDDVEAGPEKSAFAQFWIDAVDSNLFSTSSSHERKSWGFKLLIKLITNAPPWTIPLLFSQNLTRSLINQSKDGDRFLHAAAQSALKAIKVRAQNDPSSAAPLFIALTSRNGVVDFDRLTKTKTLEQIVISADDGALRRIVDHLHSLILRPGTDEPATVDLRRRVIADMLLHIVKTYPKYDANSLSLKEDDSWLHKLLDTFVESCYFVPTQSAKTRKIPLPPISGASRKTFQERLSSCLGRLLTVGQQIGVSFPFLVVSMIRSRDKSKHWELAFQAEESVMETVKKAHRQLEKVSEEVSKSAKNASAEGFMLLYSLSLLQVYDGDGDAVLMLEELDSCHASSSKKAGVLSAEGRDTFIEILLTFLGNPRTLFLKVAEQAFSVFASDLTADGLRSLIDILDTEESLAGQQALFQQGEDDVEEDSDDLEEASDVEMVDDEEAGSDDESDTASASSSIGGSTDEEGDSSEDDEFERQSEAEDEEELIKFNALLAQTLKTSKAVMNGDEEDMSDDEDMDDEQMMALDPHLVKIFKERSKVTNKKKERVGAKQTVVQFKSRVLDLLAIYVEKEHSNPLALDIVLPLLQRIRSNGNKQIADKSYKLLKSYFVLRKGKATLPKPAEDGTVWDLLKAIHEEAKAGGGSTLHGTACSSASVFVAKVLIALNKENYEKIVDIYSFSQKEWFMDRKSTVQPGLFTEFLNWSIQTRKQGK